MSTEDNNTQTNSAAISSEQIQGRPHKVIIHKTLSNRSLNWQIVIASVKQAYPNYANRALSRALRVKRSRIVNWVRGQSLPPVDMVYKLADELERMGTIALRAAAQARIEADARRTQPRQHRGFMQVKDHDDGLPPHNQQMHTLAALGLVKRDQLGKSLASQKPKGD